jgi:putative transposase
LIDADSYLLELTRYIHNNPRRSGQVQKPDQYQWSSHRAYLKRETISWLTTDFVLSQFANIEKKARQLFGEFCLKGIAEEHRQEFHRGTFDGRVLGDDKFSEETFAKASEKFHSTVGVEKLVRTGCKAYGLNKRDIAAPGKQQPAAEARAMVGYLAKKAGKPSLTELGRYFQRDMTALSRAASRLHNRLNDESDLADKLKRIKSELARKSEFQA